MRGHAFLKRTQPFGYLMRTLGREIQLNDFDRDGALVGRIFRAKNGTETACADLVQDTEAAKRRGNAER